MPLAMTGGSAWSMSLDIQAGVNCSLPLFSSTFNATIAPCFTVPFEIGGLNSGCTGPQKGVKTQRVDFESSQLAMLPQIPADAKFTSSLQSRGVRNTGV